MRVLFLNQYFPPDPAPTGILLRELADDHATRGHTVDFVAAREEYRGAQKKGGRTRREMSALFRMLIEGMQRPRADVVIAGSSPPCLSFVAALVAVWHRAKAVHWIMDLYPEIAVDLDEISDGALARNVTRAMGWAYRRAARVVVLDEDMAERLRKYGVEPAIVRPWLFASVLARPVPAIEPTFPWTWIYSGNLGRAHEWETLLLAQAIIEQSDPEARLLFQGGGPSWPAAQERANQLGLKRCDWKPYVDEAELPASLLRAQVCAVTQIPATRGCLWPSKLGLVRTLPRPLLWIGPEDGAIATELRSHPHAGVFCPGDAEGVARWVLERKKSATFIPPEALADPRGHRDAALARWRELLSAFEE
jgi:colanic acid biosynthesis glycosyl transferase WcaI